MSNKKGKLIILIIFVIVVVSSVMFMANDIFIDYMKIHRVLQSESYSYLPKNAQNYIKDVYNETNKIILTEKNKEKNTPYLNPKYVSYLELPAKERKKVALIPDIYVIDYQGERNEETSETFPSYYNLGSVNGKNYLSPMYHQGNLGLCWAFASIEQAESYVTLKKNESFNSLSDRFSVRQLDYATSYYGINNYSNEVASRYLTEGGNFHDATIMMSYGMTLIDDDKWKYNEYTYDMELADVLNFDNSKYELESAVVMPILSSSSTVTDRNSFNSVLKGAIKNYGGAYIGTYSPQSSCGFLNKDGNYAMVDADGCGDDEGHAMHLVGWDDNYQYSYCKLGKQHLSVNSKGTCDIGTLTNGTGAWILKNSWGENNPYKYVYLGYSSYGFDVGFTTSLVSMENRTWDNVYNKAIYDEEGYYFHYYKDEVNYYKEIDTPEKIEKVKFIATGDVGTYKLSVTTPSKSYSNVKTIIVKYPGIYTFDLSSNNIVLNDDEFTVSIIGENGAELYMDSLSVFTSNISSDVSIVTYDLYETDAEFNDAGDLEFLVYSDTKNIDSNETVEYSLYKDGIDYSDYIIDVKNNRVAINNVNATITLDGNMIFGNYILKTSYGNDAFESDVYLAVFSYDGSGTEEDPYLIYDEEQLRNVRYLPDSYFLLKNDITLTSDWISIGDDYSPFTGGFDGGNHTIRGLKQNNDSEDSYLGFFGLVEPRRTTTSAKTYIRNITFENVDISGSLVTAGLIGGIVMDQYEEYDAVYGPSMIDISGINFVGGKIKSSSGLGIIASLVHVGEYSYDNPTLNINNIFVSTVADGYNYSGLIGFASNEYMDNKLNINVSNIQSVGEIKYYPDGNEDRNAYTPGISAVIGNVSIDLKNYIFNNLIGDTEYMKYFVNNKPLYFVGYYDTQTYPKLSYNATNGYYISKYYSENNNFVSSLDVKNNKEYLNWTDFSKYWKVENGKIPVLKSIDYDYTSDFSDIYLEKGDVVSLFDSEINYGYVSYEVISNDNIVLIEDNLVDSISVTALKAGTVVVKMINHYDGNEKNINIVVNPVITYYKTDNSSEMYTQESIIGAVKLIPNEFTKEGYKFVGWNTEINGSGISYDDEEEINISGDLTLYAQWEKIKYNVSFDANGGEGSMGMQEFEYAVPLKLDYNKFTREGYMFKNWNTKSDGSGKIYNNEEEISITESLTLYAQWEKLEYRVGFDSNGGIGFMESQEFEYGVPLKLNNNEFTKEGYRFKNWNTHRDGSGISYDDGAEINIAEALVLYAQWEPLKYNVSFDSNGGAGSMSIQEFEHGIPEKINNNEFTKEGYRFKNWNTKIDGSGKTYNNGEEISVTNSLTLYAQWELLKYNVSFDSNGGAGSMSIQEFEHGIPEKINNNEFTKEGYRFKNWNTNIDGSGKTYSNGEEISVTNSLTLYAQWELLKYNVSFDPNGGAGSMGIQEFEHGVLEKINNNEFTKEGYVFMHWNTEKDDSGKIYSNGEEISVTTNLTLYAIWEEVHYMINSYVVDNDNKYIDLIEINTTKQEFQKNIVLGNGYSVVVETKEIDGIEMIYTGGKTRIYKGDILFAEYTNIIRGEITGDGIVNYMDYVYVYNHIYKTKHPDSNKILLTNEYMLAADADNDGVIGYLDYVEVYNKIKELKGVSN